MSAADDLLALNCHTGLRLRGRFDLSQGSSYDLGQLRNRLTWPRLSFGEEQMRGKSGELGKQQGV